MNMPGLQAFYRDLHLTFSFTSQQDSSVGFAVVLKVYLFSIEVKLSIEVFLLSIFV